VSLLSHAACASMSTTTTTTRDRGVRYGPMEWAQLAIMRQCTSVTDRRTDRRTLTSYSISARLHLALVKMHIKCTGQCDCHSSTQNLVNVFQRCWNVNRRKKNNVQRKTTTGAAVVLRLLQSNKSLSPETLLITNKGTPSVRWNQLDR